ncbi:MAG TPA: phosphopantothenoylcysteine decarboxylase [Pirellulales bacterium]|jgi:phosphopantothenoylcysteine decarboxylase/phosphopantothenate--cysteine ligase|nr:phosphopantothenoylcysteine decarboxylase [Pirellulales bacterium]
MARILITSGPTRQHLDPVRYLTNASSGRMGQSLAQAALDFGHSVVIISGPVEIAYPPKCEVIPVVSTEEMLATCQRVFPECDGLIGVAAPSDYRPVRVEEQKIKKTGESLVLHLVETPDIVATLAAAKRPEQWLVGFALEMEDQRFRAVTKMQKKSCDLMVLNGPQAISALENSVEVLDRSGEVVATISGAKETVARELFGLIQQRLIR